MQMEIKIDFKTENVRRDKGHYIIVNGVIQQEDISLINVYAPNSDTPKYVKKRLLELKEEIGRNTIIVDLNTPLSTLDSSSRQKINREIQDLNDTIN